MGIQKMMGKSEIENDNCRANMNIDLIRVVLIVAAVDDIFWNKKGLIEKEGSSFLSLLLLLSSSSKCGQGYCGETAFG